MVIFLSLMHGTKVHRSRDKVMQLMILSVGIPFGAYQHDADYDSIMHYHLGGAERRKKLIKL